MLLFGLPRITNNPKMYTVNIICNFCNYFFFSSALSLFLLEVSLLLSFSIYLKMFQVHGSSLLSLYILFYGMLFIFVGPHSHRIHVIMLFSNFISTYLFRLCVYVWCVSLFGLVVCYQIAIQYVSINLKINTMVATKFQALCQVIKI